MSFDHSGKIAMITGAGSGIGRATALRLASQGAAVAVVDIQLEAAEETVASIADGGGTGVAFDADVRDRSEIESARDGAVNAFGHIDYLVNNAGLVRMSPLDELSEDEWDLVLDTNLKGMYLVTQAIAPVIAGAGGGAIVNLATIESEVVVASTGPPAGPLQRVEGRREDADEGARGRARRPRHPRQRGRARDRSRPRSSPAPTCARPRRGPR